LVTDVALDTIFPRVFMPFESFSESVSFSVTPPLLPLPPMLALGMDGETTPAEPALVDPAAEEKEEAEEEEEAANAAESMDPPATPGSSVWCSGACSG
jgi:hypothetical protein